MLFIVIFFVVALCSYWELSGGLSENVKRKIFLILFGGFYLLSFLRWEYGPDWEGYYSHFDAYTWESLDQQEIGYIITLLLAKTFINDYTFVLFCFSTILFFFQVKGVSKLSILPLTSLFVMTGTYFCYVGYARQHIAVAIAFYSLIYIRERKLAPFIICFILAFGFHYSALVFLPAYWIYNLKFSRKQLLLFLLISVFLSSVMMILLQSVGDVSGIASIAGRTEGYLDQGYDYEDGSTLDTRQLIIKACINRGVIFLIIFYLFDKIRNSDSWTFYNGLFNLYFFGTILFFMSSPLHITLTRMSWYYDFVQVLIIPVVFVYTKKKYTKFVFFCIMTLYLAGKLYLNFNAYEGDNSYKFIPFIENMLV